MFVLSFDLWWWAAATQTTAKLDPPTPAGAQTNPYLPPASDTLNTHPLFGLSH